DLIDDRGLGGVLGDRLVVALGGGLLDAQSLARIAAGERVGGSRDAGGGAVVAGAVALQPEVAGAGACGCPAAAGGGERLADVRVARAGRRGGVVDLIDDRGLGGVLGDGLIVRLRRGLLDADRLAGVTGDERVGAGGGAADAGAAAARRVALQPLVG